jgi:lipoprotein-anchoring transpeptidase ErfK/SrfK
MVMCFIGAALSLSTQRWSFPTGPKAVAVSSKVKAIPLPPLPEPSPISSANPSRPLHPEQPAYSEKFISYARTASNFSRLVVDLSDRHVYLYRSGKIWNSYPIAVGQASWETPQGTFQVMEMQEYPIWRHPITKEIVLTGTGNPLGSRWIGFWMDDEHQIGFHGTNEPDLIGQAISHGCIRMYNSDIEELYDQVAINTPVIVRP